MYYVKVLKTSYNTATERTERPEIRSKRHLIWLRTAHSGGCWQCSAVCTPVLQDLLL